QQLHVRSGRRAVHAGRHLPSHTGRIAVGPDAASGRWRRLPIRTTDLEDRDLRSDELPEPARPRLRRLGPRPRLRCDGRAAVLRTVVLDEEVLPGDGEHKGAAPGRGADATGWRHRDSVERTFPRVHAGEPDRAEHDWFPRPVELPAGPGRCRTED